MFENWVLKKIFGQKPEKVTEHRKKIAKCGAYWLVLLFTKYL